MSGSPTATLFSSALLLTGWTSTSRGGLEWVAPVGFRPCLLLEARRSAVTGRSAEGASTRQKPQRHADRARARQRERGERRLPRTPHGLRPDPAHLRRRAN